MNTDNNLKTALYSLMQERIFNTVDAVPQTPNHVFSKRFERKMNRLIRSVENRRLYRGEHGTPGKITVKKIIMVSIATILAVTAALTMSVSAFREAFVKFFTKIFGTHTVVQTVPDNNSTETIEELYIITYPLENYELISQTEITEFTPWVITKYSNEYNYIIMKQYVKKYYNLNINTENNDFLKISINGNEGYMVDMGNNILISWDNSDYIFTIEGNVGENSLIQIAESVQKVE